MLKQQHLIATYSSQPDVVAQERVSCICVTADTAVLLERSEKIKCLGIPWWYNLYRECHHSIAHRYELILLMMANITLKQCNTLNPVCYSTPFTGARNSIPRSCSNLWSWKGLRRFNRCAISRSQAGTRCRWVFVLSEQQPYGLFNNYGECSSGGFTLRLKWSAQAVELIASTKACQLAKEMTDSWCAFGVCHATGQ